MKKIVGTIAAIALATSAAFAEVNVGMGYNDAIFTPFAMRSGANPQMSLTAPFDAAPRIGVSFSGSNDVCGVVADIKFDGGNVRVNDNAYVWIKPISWFKMQFGQSFDDTLRGSYAFGSNSWLRPGNILNDDITFDRLSKPNELWNPVTGAILALDPVEGLHIAAAFNIPGYSTRLAENVINDLQVQAGYNIANIVQIKAQWIGWKKTVNAAVALKAVENMTLEAGVYIPTVSDKAMDIGAFWGMPIGPVALHLNAKFTVPNESANEKGNLKAGFGLDFDVGNGVGIGADVVLGQSFAANAKTGLAFSAYVTKAVANGCFGIGFQGAMNDTLREFATSDFTIAIPIKVQVGF